MRRELKGGSIARRGLADRQDESHEERIESSSGPLPPRPSPSLNLMRRELKDHVESGAVCVYASGNLMRRELKVQDCFSIVEEMLEVNLMRRELKARLRDAGALSEELGIS